MWVIIVSAGPVTTLLGEGASRDLRLWYSGVKTIEYACIGCEYLSNYFRIGIPIVSGLTLNVTV